LEVVVAKPFITVSPVTWRRLHDPRVLGAIALVVVGAIAEILGYLGVSGTIDPGEQLPYIISGGIGGLFILGVAAALLLSVDSRSIKADVANVADELAALRAEITALRAELSAPPAELSAPRAELSAPPRRRRAQS
jgi:hypothetical protein